MSGQFEQPPPTRRSFQLALGGVMLVAVMLAVISVDRPRAKVPPMPDFGSYQRVEDMKAAFIDYLTPIIQYYNARILEDRRQLQRVSASIANSSGKPSWVDAMRLQQLGERYAVTWDEDEVDKVLRILARRVDIIPAPLVLVQAAKESSWGQSRFAVEAHNLFGQWCFEEGCGLKPQQREVGAKHEVRRFETVGDSIRSYLRNLNTHDGYLKLRQIREQLRERNQPVTAQALAEGLSLYSERREAYVREVKSMIAQYHKFQRARDE